VVQFYLGPFTKLPNIPVPDLPLPKPIPPSTYKLAVTDGFEHSCMAAGLSSVFRFHPRVSAVIFVGVGSVSFIDILYTFKKD
jgi:hypothetical protein